MQINADVQDNTRISHDQRASPGASPVSEFPLPNHLSLRNVFTAKALILNTGKHNN